MAVRRMTIGVLARAAGVGVETIRYYERLRLIDQPVRAGGARVYSDLHVRQLHYIRNAKALRMSLKDIVELRSKLATGPEFCAATRTVVTQRLREVEGEIDRLTETRTELVAFLNRCAARPADRPCPVLVDLAPRD
ncbi:MAG: MerR family transcriptional regulator [Sphingomonas sp.]|nr:MerR family transcriptional regulator [Sphingomonas sp.]